MVDQLRLDNKLGSMLSHNISQQIIEEELLESSNEMFNRLMSSSFVNGGLV
jgi:hypothetical protein